MFSSLVLASTNAGKIKELSAMLNPLGIEVLSQASYVPTPAVENGQTFIENAILKARWAAKFSKLPALGDDSGLVVDALGGAPGLYSSRYAGENATDAQNNQKLLHALSEFPDTQRYAYFYCALALLRHEDDPAPYIATAAWHGHILHAPIGENGFGYDPLFWVSAFQKSSAQLSATEKNAVSHRAKAILQLKAMLCSEL